mgnify:CR=1 FL=1
MAITESKYLKARQIVREYELQEREKYLIEKAKPCPSCGSKTDDNGDCRKCGIMFINGVHSVNNCKEYHTHSNSCLTPFSGSAKV